MKIKVSHKSNDLTSILVSHFGKKMNLARIKFLGFEKLAAAFDSPADTSSTLRRIQLLYKLMPKRGNSHTAERIEIVE